MEKCYLFGAGNNAYGVIEYIGSEKIAGVIDNESKVQNSFIKDIPILSFEKFLTLYKGEPVVITAAMYEEIIKQLNDNGINCYTIAPMIIMGMAKEKQIVDEFHLSSCKRIFFLGYNILTECIAEYLLTLDSNKEFWLLEDNNTDVQFISPKFKLASYNMISTEDRVVVCKEQLTEKDVFFLRNRYIIYDIYDLVPEKNKKYIQLVRNLKDIHKKQKCIIVGNGPSLRMEDLEKISDLNIDTFGLNLIYNVYSMTKWRPTYYIISDYKILRTYWEELKQLEHTNMFIKNFFCINEKEFFDKSIYFSGYARRTYNNPQFSCDVSKVVYSGYSVMFDALQIAVYMGYSEIYLIGADFSYLGSPEAKGNHIYDAYMTDKRKFSGNAYIATSIKAFEAAKVYAENQGINIFNATRGGKLEVFERIDIDNFFKEQEYIK